MKIESELTILENYSDLFINYAYVTAIGDSEPLYEGYIHVIDKDSVIIEEADKNWSVIKYKHIKVINQDVNGDDRFRHFYATDDYQRLTPESILDKKIEEEITKQNLDEN